MSVRDPDSVFLPTKAPLRISAAAGVVYVAVALLIALNLPAQLFDPASVVFILAIGLIGIWRYGWWSIHLARAVIYRNHVYPRLRRDADRRAEHPDHIFVLVTSFRIRPEVTYRVYESILRNAASYGIPTTVIASLSDRSDVDVLDHVIGDLELPRHVTVRYMFQRGDGKRSAMAEVLRAVSRSMPSERSLVVFMDGDIRLPDGTFRRSMPFFCDRRVGAVTTHNRGIVDGDAITREWYDLRFAQRHLLMSSMALSRRLLVLTGRYSIIRADLATDPSFIDQLENDTVDHWRFGRFKFLSGDDKSTWFWLLQRGWHMLYLPDVEVHGFEELPDRKRFFASSVDLMRRWYGNMLRINGRAISVGPRPMGLFTWWSLIDQRLSMWTGLIGPSVAILMTVFVRPSFLLAYLLWIMGTRLVASTILGLQHGRFSFVWPSLLYYSQITGALVKTYVNFRYNRQRWTRQGISSGTPDGSLWSRWQCQVSRALHGACVTAFLFVVALMLGVMPTPDLRLGETIARDFDRSVPSGDWWLAPAIAAASDGGSVRLPGGSVAVSRDSLSTGHRAVTLIGGGPEPTELHLSGSLAGLLQSVPPPSQTTGSGHYRIDCSGDNRICRIGLPEGGTIRIARAALIVEASALPRELMPETPSDPVLVSLQTASSLPLGPDSEPR